MNLLLSAFVLLFAVAPVVEHPQSTGDLVVSISNLKNQKGQVGILIFSQETGFPMESSKAIRDVLIPIQGSTLQYTFSNLPFGKYAVSVMHDENKNQEFDTNLFGMPEEGYGVSNNVVGRMGPPSFTAAAFQFQKDNQSVDIQVRY
jgi:uncharacterized protein (DUF2141 family)